MAKYKVEINREDCIGCGNCQSINPDTFNLSDDGKMGLKGGSPVEGKENWTQVEVDDDNLNKTLQAESECPVSVIKVTKLEEKEE